MESNSEQIILAFVFDLFFVSRIESVSKKLGVETIFWDPQERSLEPTQMAPSLQNMMASYKNRSLQLVLLDLSAPGFPWEMWLKGLKSVQATAEIPVVAFGSHVNVDILKDARAAGAAEALAKSRFTTKMPEILNKYLK
jgi:DNA-binding NtrC family response regulator